MRVSKASLWHDIFHAGFSPEDRVKYERAFIINLYALLAMVSLGVFGCLHIIVELNPIVGFVEITGAVLIAVSMLVMRLTKSTGVASTWLLCIIIALLVVMLITGGTAGTGIFWCFIFPIMAFLLTNKMQGVVWMLILGGVIGALLLLAQEGLVSLSYSAVTIRQLLVVLLMLAIGIYGYQRSRERLQARSLQNEHELEAEKIQAHTVLEYIDEGVVVVNGQGKVVLINQAAQDMLGWTLAELEGNSFTHMVPLVNKAGENIMPGHLEPNRILHLPNDTVDSALYQRKDGTTFPVIVEVKAITINGQVLGTVTAFRDVTQEQAVNRAKTEFVTLASHQLRTPLSAIAWYSEMLLNGDVGKLTTDQKDYIEQIYQSNQRSTEMVDAMLKASSLELGNVLTKPTPLDIPRLTHEVLNQQLKAADGKKLIVTENYDKSMKPVLYDKPLVKTILQNLISNAIKYTPDGGSLTLTVRITDEKVRYVSLGSVFIEVSDNGYGIPKRQQQKVFEKLFRAENIKAKDTNGTGLGLYAVKMAVKYLGGKLRFSSTENQGSTFVVLLPLEGMKGTKGSHVTPN